MKKRFISTLTVFISFILLFPSHAFATDGYVASKNSDVFHEPDCSYVDRIANHNLISFDTLEEAIVSGRRGCSRCNPEVGNYTRNSNNTSDDDFDTSSYTYGFYYGKEYGYDLGFDEGYDQGYDVGYEKGHYSGYMEGKEYASSIYNEQIEEAVSDAKSDAYLTCLGIFATICLFIPAILARKAK